MSSRSWQLTGNIRYHRTPPLAFHLLRRQNLGKLRPQDHLGGELPVFEGLILPDPGCSSLSLHATVCTSPGQPHKDATEPAAPSTMARLAPASDRNSIPLTIHTRKRRLLPDPQICDSPGDSWVHVDQTVAIRDGSCLPYS